MQFTQDTNFKSLKLPELKDIARQLKLKGFSMKTKSELVSMIEKSFNPDNISQPTTKLGDTQNNIWTILPPLTSLDDLNTYTKLELLNMYNNTARSNNLDILTTTWNSKSKDDIIRKVEILFQDGLEIIPPPKLNTSSIPIINKGTFLIGKRGGGYSSIYSCVFGSVKEQKVNGTVKISELITNREQNIDIVYLTPTPEISRNIFTAVPQPSDNKWSFVTKDLISPIYWELWCNGNGDFNGTYMYTETHDDLK